MAWETRRNGRTYYYSKQRVGRRVISEYVGSGDVATIIADLSAVWQNRALCTREQETHTRLSLAAGDAPLDELETLLTGLTRAVLLANGYHTHKGTWRRTRDKTEGTNQSP
jgi:hypothetical protein